jgi:hypothetical protein
MVRARASFGWAAAARWFTELAAVPLEEAATTEFFDLAAHRLLRRIRLFFWITICITHALFSREWACASFF